MSKVVTLNYDFSRVGACWKNQLEKSASWKKPVGKKCMLEKVQVGKSSACWKKLETGSNTAFSNMHFFQLALFQLALFKTDFFC